MESPTPHTLAARFAWTERLLAPSLALLAAWLIFPGLAGTSFHDGDEALYASIAREMASSGELLTPSYWGEPLLNKPPLLYWLMTASIAAVDGPLELLARLPSALAGLTLLALVYWIARRLGGMWCALGATLLMLGNHQYLFEHCVRSANLDSGLVTVMFAAIVFGARAHQRRGELVLSALCSAAILMIKLPLAVFVMPTLFVFLWSQERSAAWRWLRWTAGCVAVVALPWHAYAFAVHGAEFWDVYFMYEIFGRTGEAVLDPDATWWTHLLALWKSFMPWGPLLSIAGVAALFGWPGDASERSTSRLLAAYALFVLVFFCFIKSKWPWYGLPAYPALAVLGALFVRNLACSRLRAWAPVVVAVPVLFQLLYVGANADYEPASRAAHLWPLKTQLYSLGFAGAKAFAWGLALLVSLLAALPWLRSRDLAGRATLASATIGLGLGIVTIARVPRDHRTPASLLADELANERVDRVLTVGFWPSATYQGRQMPLTSVYFLGVPGAKVIDGRDSFACLSEGLTERTALVVHKGTLKPKVRRYLEQALPTLSPAPRVWILDPAPHGSYREFKWPR